MFKLSTLFYLIPLYIFVIAPLLRQLLPSNPSSTPEARFPSNHEDENDENILLNADLLGLNDDTDTSLSCDPDNYRVHILSLSSPLVIYIEDFLSEYEADYLVNISTPSYTPSIIYNGHTTTLDPTRRLSDRALLPRNDTVVRCVERRARAFQGWKPHLYIERMWAQRYNVSGHYTHHYDWVGSARGRGGDRLSTFMVYLDARCKGGGTNFPRLRRPVGAGWCRFVECDDEEQDQDRERKEGGGGGGGGVTFRPIKGNAVFWENLRPDGSGYAETWHAAFPVTEGEKVGLNIWSWYQPPRGVWR